MPRVKPLGRSVEELMIEQQLIDFNKGHMFLDMKTICDFIGNYCRNDVEDWLTGTPCWVRGQKRKKRVWNVSDIAHLIYSQMDYEPRGVYRI